MIESDSGKSCVLVYHRGCTDGFCAAWLFWQLYGDRIDYRPFQHGDPVDVSDFAGKRVVVVDFSWKRPTVEAINAVAESLTVLDHHASAEKELKGLPYCTFDMERSGARMAWDWLQTRGFPMMTKGDRAPQNLRASEWIVNYVQDGDLWRFELPDSKEIVAAIKLMPWDFEEWDQMRSGDRREMAAAGWIVCQAHRQFIDLHTSKAHKAEIGGHVVPCVNATVLHSDIAGELAEGHPFAVAYFDTPDKRVWSLRSREGGVDVSEVAGQYGGGGHKNAAGFQTDLAERFPVGTGSAS